MAERLARGPLPVSQVLRYGAEIAGALDKAHRAGIVHRDLKPGNVMLTKSGGTAPRLRAGRPARTVRTAWPFELDAPLERRLKAQFSAPVHYMAPEQVEGRGGGPAHRYLRARHAAVRSRHGQETIRWYFRRRRHRLNPEGANHRQS